MSHVSNGAPSQGQRPLILASGYNSGRLGNYLDPAALRSVFVDARLSLGHSPDNERGDSVGDHVRSAPTVARSGTCHAAVHNNFNLRRHLVSRSSSAAAMENHANSRRIKRRAGGHRDYDRSYGSILVKRRYLCCPDQRSSGRRDKICRQRLHRQRRDAERGDPLDQLLLLLGISRAARQAGKCQAPIRPHGASFRRGTACKQISWWRAGNGGKDGQRRSHTIKTTPAVKAGLTDYVWTLREMLTA